MPQLSQFNKSCLAIAIAQTLSVSSIHAASIEVTTRFDTTGGSSCALREALNTINAGDDLGNGCIIDTSQGQLGNNDTIHFEPNYVGGRSVVLQNGELPITKSVTINGDNRIGITAQGASRALNISGMGNSVVLNDLGIRNGSSMGDGGAIKIDAANVTINNSSVSNSTAVSSHGGGIFASNSAFVQINNSTVSGNSAVFGAGVTASSAIVILNNSTISSNSAEDYAGGILSKISSNVHLNNTTVSDNMGGSGVYVTSGAGLSLNNSIVANSVGGSDCENDGGTINAGANNIIEDGACNTSAMAVDPKLGSIDNNGGATATHALLSGSAAIDAATGAGAINTDQRGFGAVGVRDIGAFEYGATAGLDLTVTSTADDDGAGCTLREAIATVNAGQELDNGCIANGVSGDPTTIRFAEPNVAGNTITLEVDGEGFGNRLSIRESVNIIGDSTTIDAAGESGVMHIFSFGESATETVVSLQELTITGGDAAEGGGIETRLATVNLNNCTVTGNTAQYGAGIYIDFKSNVSINNSTISGNLAQDNGGGISVDYSTLSLLNSTVSSNMAEFGGGIYARSTTAEIANSTISNNMTTGSVGGGIYAWTALTSINLTNSIVANTVGATDCVSVSAYVTAGGDNIIEDGSCGTSALAVDPQLGPLVDNGGPTLTHLPAPSSPAINAGNNATCLAEDQRGEARARSAGDACDIGAVEAADDSSFYVIPLPNGKVAVIPL